MAVKNNELFKILQINLNHCRLAHQLVAQTALEQGAEIVIISEPLTISRDWVTNDSGRVALWVTDSTTRRNSRLTFSGSAAVAVDVGGYTIFSCYLPPSLSQQAFEGSMDEIGAAVRSSRFLPIVAGDFNSKSPLWGSNTTDRRGKFLENWAEIHGLVPLLADGGPTFSINGRTSVVDFAMVAPTISRRWESSVVLNNVYSASDHLYVRHAFNRSHLLRKNESESTHGKHSESLLLSGLAGWSPDPSPINPDEETAVNWAETSASSLQKIFDDAWVPFPKKIKKRVPCLWWSQEIAQSRREANRKRRALTTARSRGRDSSVVEPLLDLYKIARKKLHLMITKAKEQCWKKLCEEVELDKWGRPYRTVLTTLSPPTPAQFLDSAEARCKIRELFCTEPPQNDETSECDPLTDSCVQETLIFDPPAAAVDAPLDTCVIEPVVTKSDIINIARSINIKKASGPDRISARATRVALLTYPDKMASLFSNCARLGLFPSQWKKARLVLIPKKDDKGKIKGYRPLSVISNIAKVYERLIKKWLCLALENDPLNDRQYGFRPQRTTLQAIRLVMKGWEMAKKKGKHCLLVALDVRNAFNCITRKHLLTSLQHKNLPSWLRRILVNYLFERRIIYESSDGVIIEEEVHAGVPQGSVVGPILWNVGYDAVLSVPAPPGVELIAYADDLAVLATDADQEALADKVSRTIDLIIHWMSQAGLQLAAQKTEAVLLTGRKRKTPINIRVGADWISTGSYVKYLGVTIQGSLTFIEHVNRIVKKAKGVAGVLARITPNVGGAGLPARRCYYRVVEAILLYASPTWGCALDFRLPRRRLQAAQKQALIRVSRAYRTVSWEALCVLSGVPPIDLIAEERKKSFNRKWPSVQHKKALTAPEPPPRNRYLLRKRPEIMVDTQDIMYPEIFGSETSDSDTESVTSSLMKDSVEEPCAPYPPEKEAEALEEDRKCTLLEWQRRWTISSRGEKTRRFIPKIDRWITWGPGFLTFRITQIITGHGCFAEYLHRIEKIKSPGCWHCPHPVDDVTHTLITCVKWDAHRTPYVSKWGEIEVETLIDKLAESEDMRQDFASMVESIMREKEYLQAEQHRAERRARRR